MCIIILNEKETLKYDILKTAWENNPDGAGLFYANNNRVQVFKELNNFTRFYNEYLTVRTNTKNPIGLHFRIGTSGVKTLLNVHPFKVNKHLYFAHNGIIDIHIPKNSLKNDTQIFNETILKKLPNNFLYSEAILELIAGYIGFSKLLFMDNLGQFLIVNEDLGHWDNNGNWFSNHSYQQKTSKIGFMDFANKPIQSQACGDNCMSDFCYECGEYLWSDAEVEEGLCTKCLTSLYGADYYSYLSGRG